LLSQRSLRKRFNIELAVGMTAFLLFISLILTIFFSKIFMNNIKQEMRQQANYIIKTYPNPVDYNQKIDNTLLKAMSNYEVLIASLDERKNKPKGISAYKDNGQDYLEFAQHYTSYDNYLIIKRNVTKERNFISKMNWMIFILVLLGIVSILLYANMLSKKIMEPLETLTGRITDMNESLIHQVKIDELPSEFKKLGESVNQIMTKISTSINYRKELYVGTAHELKTPLAVMRLKNQITLMKYKQQDKIRETLEQNIESIDTLNAMIHNILEFGRAEGAQFEKPERVNLIRLMATKAEEYELLAQSQNRNFIYYFSVSDFKINVQPLLFMQIFQNFIQNALRFTPENGLVSLETRMDSENFIIEIMDEGCGIDPDKDVFAPFQRSLDSTGAGLGLFLAQNAAESMGVIIDLKNRKTGTGAIASIKFPLDRFLLKK